MASLTLIPEDKICFSSNESMKNNMKLPCALNKRKTLHPLLSRTSISITSNRPKYISVPRDKIMPKRLLSAKDHKLKQIQNQLADAHFHLNELTNENRLLKNLQKRMDSALHRYENSSGEIPNILHRHNEEIRSWQVRYKQLKNQFKDTALKLKEKDIEYQQLKDEHKHLTTLSNNEKLGEREKLQNQVYDLTEKLNKQNESINLLQRKLNLETKSYKHQLHVEMVKHRETQFQLNETISNNERLTTLLEKKEKIIASNLTRRSPKVISEKKIIHNYNFGSSKSLLNLNLLLKDYSIANSEDSTGFSSKLDSSGDTTFVINEKLVAKEMFQKSNHNFNHTNGANETFSQTPHTNNEPNSIKAVAKSIPTNNVSEKDNDNINNSNDNAKDRVDVLKDKIRSQSKISVYKHKLRMNEINKNNDDVLSNNSSPEQQIIQKHVDTNNYFDVSGDSYSSEDSIKDNSLSFDFNNMNRTITELEKESAKERDLVEELIDGFCNEVIEKAENATKVSDKTKKAADDYVNNTRTLDKTNDIPTKVENEVNNNTKALIKKNGTDLDEEKKKKLLAKLKAIDRGDDDGLKIESLGKTRMRSKILRK